MPTNPLRPGRRHEQRPAPCLRPAVLEIGDQRLAHIDRQRQPLHAVPLAANEDLAGPPVDVIQT